MASEAEQATAPPAKKAKRRTETSWGESISAALILTCEDRLEAMESDALKRAEELEIKEKKKIEREKK